MSALMLDPCFKSLQVLESFVRHDNTIHLVTKCDVKDAHPSFDDYFLSIELYC
jgi:hypothetical protein